MLKIYLEVYFLMLDANLHKLRREVNSNVLKIYGIFEFRVMEGE